jgi:hypothetical protein
LGWPRVGTGLASVDFDFEGIQTLQLELVIHIAAFDFDIGAGTVVVLEAEVTSQVSETNTVADIVDTGPAAAVSEDCDIAAGGGL